MREATSKIRALLEALPPALAPRTKVSAALAELAAFGDDYLIVGSHRSPRGVLARAEVERAVRFGLGDWPLEHLTIGELRRVPLSSSVSRAARELRHTVLPLVVVTDSRGRPVGCLTRRRLGPDTAGEGTDLLTRLPQQSQDLLRQVGRAAPQGAWLVGGVVRDLLLARPNGDLDVVLAGAIEPVLAILGGSARAHGRFGTGTIEKDGLRIDLAQARRESYAKPGALPVVECAGLADDLFRRDFTVNALAIAIDGKSWGQLVELYGSCDDLARRRLRVFHGLSFIDDPTRTFRAVRFAARLRFQIESRTRRSLRLALATGAIDRLTPARLLREVRLALSEEETQRVTSGLERQGLLASLGLDAKRARSALRRLPATLRWYADLPHAPAPVAQWIVALGLMLPREAAGALSRLGPSREEREALEEITMRARELDRQLARQRPRSAIWRACQKLRPSTWVAALAWSGDPRTRRALALHVGVLRRLSPAIDGDDLRRAGVAPGPAIAKGHDAARGALLDGRAPDAASQLRVALRASRSG